MSAPHDDDATLAGRLARSTGELLLAARADHLAGGGRRGPALQDLGDRVAQTHIADVLARERPADAVLSEEAPDDPARLDASRVWIIDPLDGTREYGEDRHDWAVHVALWADGALVTGAVALPDEDAVLVAGEQATPARPGIDPLRFAVSRSRSTRLVDATIDRLGGMRVRHGSAGYKAMAVVRGDVDAYLHAGGQFQWDSAAPVVVARAAGLHTSRIDGSPLRYNTRETWLPDLLIARPDAAPRILSALAAERR